MFYSYLDKILGKRSKTLDVLRPIGKSLGTIELSKVIFNFEDLIKDTA